VRQLTHAELVAAGKLGRAASGASVRRRHRRELMREIQVAYDAGALRNIDDLLKAFAQEIIRDVE